MHDALSHTRVHSRDRSLTGKFCPDGDEENCVRVDHTIGPHFRIMGWSDSRNRTWLLPEEALYLLERGSIDIRWPDTEGFEGENTIPMSLEGAYSVFIGRAGLTLERYSVYAGLKRCGYIVVRAPSWNETDRCANGADNRQQQISQAPTTTSSVHMESNGVAIFIRRICQYLFTTPTIGNRAVGPMIAPGLHRSYNDIYRALNIIPFHDPCVDASPSPSTKPPFRIAYHVYKPSPQYKRSMPPDPDFRLAVIDARSSFVPKLEEIGALLDSVPYDPPREGRSAEAKIKQGSRTAHIAVVDAGVVSYMKVSDAAFGREKIYEERVRRSGKYGRRGGHRGRGRGR